MNHLFATLQPAPGVVKACTCKPAASTMLSLIEVLAAAGSSQQPPKEAGRWAQRHQPAGREALVIHKDKVNAVDSWLLAQLQEGSVGGSHCLLITGV